MSSSVLSRTDRVIASVTIQRLTAWKNEEIMPPIPIYGDDIDDAGIFHRYQRNEENIVHSSVSEIMHKMRHR